MHITDKTDIELTDANDNTSDTNEINTDLTNTADTLSDIVDDFSDNVEPTADDATSPHSPSATDELYNSMEQHLLSLDPLTTMALGKLTYHDNFHPHYFPPEKEGGFGKTLYKTSPPSQHLNINELGLMFFGEVCPSIYGTAITAKGNHYAGTADYPKPITDKSIVKDILVLRPLSFAPSDSLVNVAFYNQCASLEEILINDAQVRSNHPSSDSVDITEFLVTSKPEENGQDRSFIKVSLPTKYKVSPDVAKKANTAVMKAPTNKKTDLLQLVQPTQPIPSTSQLLQSETDDIRNSKELPVPEIGALYDPDLLPDHRGDLFQHKNAKLVQHDIKDANDNLVAPWEMHDKLRPGTVVVVDSTLVCWHIPNKGLSRARKVRLTHYESCIRVPTKKTIPKVYQVQGHRVQILNESSEPIEELDIPILPRKLEETRLSFDTSPRKAPSSAFSTFGSASKKPRHM